MIASFHFWYLANIIMDWYMKRGFNKIRCRNIYGRYSWYYQNEAVIGKWETLIIKRVHLNEIPTVLTIIIVAMAVVKPL